MIIRNVVLSLSLFVLFACQSDESFDLASSRTDSELPTTSSDSVPTVLEGTVRKDNLLSCTGYLAEHDGEKYCVTIFPAKGTVTKGDFLSCDGYLVRYENEDYCASEVPSNWVPFQFNGYIYYRQPLSTTSE